jgi:hypothetical protein
MPCDAKHSTFLSEKRGGLGLHSFTREYMGSLIRDIEVYTSHATGGFVGTLPSVQFEYTGEHGRVDCKGL